MMNAALATDLQIIIEKHLMAGVSMNEIIGTLEIFKLICFTSKNEADKDAIEKPIKLEKDPNAGL